MASASIIDVIRKSFYKVEESRQGRQGTSPFMGLLVLDYKKIYDALVEKCKVRGLDKSKFDEYMEKHHIIPKCMGGDNSKENYVLFTAREHVVAHHLLWRSNPDNYSLMWAYSRTINTKDGKVRNSRQVAYLRKIKAEVQKNRVITQETKDKISKTLTGRKIPREVVEKSSATRTGQKRSEETKQLLSQRRQELLATGWTHSEEARRKIGESNKGRKMSDEAKEKLRQHNLGKEISEEHKKILSERQKSLKPWERSKVVSSDFRMYKWLVADELHSKWTELGKVAAWAFSTQYNLENTTDYSVSYFDTILKMFKSGWVPANDPDWVSFIEDRKVNV